MRHGTGLIEDFWEVNSHGSKVRIKLDYPIRRDSSPQDVLAFINNPSKKGIVWRHKGEDILVEDKNVSVYGLPSVDLNYVVAVYNGLNGKFTPPNNAVIYNLDGSLHRVLQMPSFISELATKRLSFLKMPNPPLEWAKFEGGLSFGGFAWRDRGNGEVVNTVFLEMERGSYEIRIIDVQKATVGECLDAGLAMYSKY